MLRGIHRPSIDTLAQLGDSPPGNIQPPAWGRFAFLHPALNQTTTIQQVLGHGFQGMLAYVLKAPGQFMASCVYASLRPALGEWFQPGGGLGNGILQAGRQVVTAWRQFPKLKTAVTQDSRLITDKGPNAQVSPSIGLDYATLDYPATVIAHT